MAGTSVASLFGRTYYQHTHTHTHTHTHSVMVLDAGRIVEYDPPAELLSNKNTVFYSMAKDAGLTA